MKRLAFLIVLLWAIVGFSFPEQTEEGKVEFSIKKAGSSVNGHFSKFEYDIEIHENGLGTIRGKADVGSVATGNSKRDKHLQTEDWFYSEKFPQIIIQSKKITKLNESEYTGLFEIGIKGKWLTKEIPFKILIKGNQKNLISSFELPIGAYDIGGGFVSLLLSNEVTINLNLPF